MKSDAHPTYRTPNYTISCCRKYSCLVMFSLTIRFLGWYQVSRLNQDLVLENRFRLNIGGFRNRSFHSTTRECESAIKASLPLLPLYYPPKPYPYFLSSQALMSEIKGRPVSDQFIFSARRIHDGSLGNVPKIERGQHYHNTYKGRGEVQIWKRLYLG